jgi:hypothetical protein
MDFSSPAYEAAPSRLRTRFGEPAEAWWQELPGAIGELSERWALAMGAPMGRGNTSLVLLCRRTDGSAAMLKLTPDTQLAVAEGRRSEAGSSYQPRAGIPHRVSERSGSATARRLSRPPHEPWQSTGAGVPATCHGLLWYTSDSGAGVTH